MASFVLNFLTTLTYPRKEIILKTTKLLISLTIMSFSYQLMAAENSSGHTHDPNWWPFVVFTLLMLVWRAVETQIRKQHLEDLKETMEHSKYLFERMNFRIKDKVEELEVQSDLLRDSIVSCRDFKRTSEELFESNKELQKKIMDFSHDVSKNLTEISNFVGLNQQKDIHRALKQLRGF